MASPANALLVIEPIEEAEATNLVALARRFLDDSPDADTAASRLTDHILNDPTLLKEVIGRQLRVIARNIIQNAVTIDRQALSGKQGRQPRTLQAAAFAEAVTISLLDYRINGRRLGDFQKLDLSNFSNGLAAQADDMKVKSRWLALVADALPDNRKTVDEALTSAKLEELRTKAREQS